jgi:hypothetical protein
VSQFFRALGARRYVALQDGDDRRRRRRCDIFAARGHGFAPIVL